MKATRITVGLLLTLLLAGCGGGSVGTSGAAAGPVAAGRLLFEVHDSGGTHLATCDGAGGQFTYLTYGATGSETEPAWSPDGRRIVFVKDGATLYTMSADGSGPVSLGLSGAYPAWSPDGARLAYESATGIATAQKNGADAQQIYTGTAHHPAWSPDGTQLAFDNGRQIYLMHADGSNVRMLAAVLNVTAHPVWRPDGALLAFTAGVPPIVELWTMTPDGGNQTQRTILGASVDSLTWSPDGAQLAFCVTGTPGGLYTIPALTGAPVIRLALNALNPSWAP